jgi:low temperature requirement protein LtrA
MFPHHDTTATRGAAPPRRSCSSQEWGFLLTTTALPHAFTGTGILFGLGYLLVVGVHAVLFTRSESQAGALRLAPYNLGAAILILVAGFLSGPAVPALWITAALVQAVLPYLVPGRSWLAVAASFRVRPEHFVERHGLLVIVALGESVVAIGIGTAVASGLQLATVIVLIAGMLALDARFSRRAAHT